MKSMLFLLLATFAVFLGLYFLNKYSKNSIKRKRIENFENSLLPIDHSIVVYPFWVKKIYKQTNDWKPVLATIVQPSLGVVMVIDETMEIPHHSTFLGGKLLTNQILTLPNERRRNAKLLLVVNEANFHYLVSQNDNPKLSVEKISSHVEQMMDIVYSKECPPAKPTGKT